MYNEFSAATYSQVREVIVDLQHITGASIKPLVLYPMFLHYIEIDNGKLSNMSRTRVRDIVETYCALCNEFYLINSKAKNPSYYFYMSKSRWDKYFLGEKAIKSSLSFLIKHNFISCEKRRNPNGINKVRLFSINLFMLKGLLLEAESNVKKRV